MSDLVVFLRARLDEDERNARDAEAQWADTHLTIDPGSLVLVDFLRRRHTPARVLREVEAKRKILTEWQHQQRLYERPSGNLNDYHENFLAGLEHALQCLAATWSDHPDYDPAWT